jgi:transcriptional regulator with XRE-family HTH domain
MKRKALRKRKPKGPTLGDNIKQARTAKGVTQLALAHAIGYTGDDAGAYISRVESDHQAPRIDTLQRIADALDVPVCSLLSISQK